MYVKRIVTGLIIGIICISLFSDSNSTYKKDYVSLQFYFEDFYSSWDYMRFLEYNEDEDGYYWEYNKRGSMSGTLHLCIGFCWRHFLTKRVFGELSLTTGAYSFEKTKVDYYSEKKEKFRMRPLEYIAQAGIGYVFYKTKNVDVFFEISGSLSAHRAQRDDLKFDNERVRSPYFVWRGEIGFIIRLPKSYFLESSIGLFTNTNFYYSDGHQVRVGIGKSF